MTLYVKRKKKNKRHLSENTKSRANNSIMGLIETVVPIIFGWDSFLSGTTIFQQKAKFLIFYFVFSIFIHIFAPSFVSPTMGKKDDKLETQTNKYYWKWNDFYLV